ncbi:MAG: multiheme c-type cytochrome [Candidatus Binatia bacterium]|nr:multiheme c-type cytochrome [Candidatus Binatia bacterium]
MTRFALLSSVVVALVCLHPVAAAAISPATTNNDFLLPGTQPLTVVDDFSTSAECAGCHSGFGDPGAEPMRAWEGSMLAQAGRDPLLWAALAIANQDVPASGETCLRCHLPKGWLEGRSANPDGSSMTADDREGVQCAVCHRMVDPFADPANPAEDAAILAGLAAPVPAFESGMMVVDSFDRLRGPLDLIGDLGGDPHPAGVSTLVSPFHESSELCGTCHNVRNPAFTKNDVTGEWELNAVDTASAEPTKGFPEQSTYDEWANSEYASTGVFAPEFGGNKQVVSTCQDCHMVDVSGRAAAGGIERDDVPAHGFAGANTFIPYVLPFHPQFGSEVDAGLLLEGAARNVDMLRKAASLEAGIVAGDLVVRVTNESGHKLPTGYPEGRRMWLHVQAFDAQNNVVFESGSYTDATATLESDPNIHVWESEMGLSAAVAAVNGQPVGKSFHLALNNVRLKDNRIPPRGFTNAAFELVDAEPVSATYADFQYWDEVTYPVGPSAVQAGVTLYYQTASREYVEFLDAENTTNAAGTILYDLWDQHHPSSPVAMAQAFVGVGPKAVASCRKSVETAQAKYRKRHYRAWSRCYEREVSGLPCDLVDTLVRVDRAGETLRERLGGVKDAKCAGSSLTPLSLGHGTVCPMPCQHIVLFDMADLASCAICQADALNGEALEAAYGSQPQTLPNVLLPTERACQASLDKAASIHSHKWMRVVARCERDNASGKNAPALDCSVEPAGKLQAVKGKAANRVAKCDDLGSIPGCATAGSLVAVEACLETAIGPAIADYTNVAYP